MLDSCHPVCRLLTEQSRGEISPNQDKMHVKILDAYNSAPVNPEPRVLQVDTSPGGSARSCTIYAVIAVFYCS